MYTDLYTLFLGLLIFGHGKLLHSPRSKIRTTADLPLKRDNRQQKRPTFVYFIYCFCNLSLVAVVRLQWKDALTFM